MSPKKTAQPATPPSRSEKEGALRRLTMALGLPAAKRLIAELEVNTATILAEMEVAEREPPPPPPAAPAPREIVREIVREIEPPKTKAVVSEIEIAMASSGREATESERAAVELFRLAHGDASPRARFMALTNVVEALADRPAPRSDEARAFLQECALFLEASTVAPDERDPLRNGLGLLHRETLTRACQAVVARHLGGDRAVEFRSLYRLRGHLPSEGVPEDLAACLARLETLVADLLRARFR